MRKSLITTAVLGALAAPAFVFAADAAPAPDLTVAYNVGLYSQYIFRGLTQTNRQPALQGGIDLTHSSGFYLGAWGSNISWLRDKIGTSSDAVYTSGGSLELDLYGGYRTDIKGVGIDVGALQYWYPGTLRKPGQSGANTTEVYGALSYGWLQGKISTVVSEDAWGFGKEYNVSSGGDDERGTYYAELNANIPLADTGITALIHVARQEFNNAKVARTGPAASYTDWKLGLTKAFDNGINVGAYYTDTNISKANAADNWTYAGKNIGDATGTVFVQKTF
jgi:uncharacterized protein (TIGR02001 family)